MWDQILSFISTGLKQQHCVKKKKKKALHQAVNLRLGGSSDSKSYETPQEQQPAIDWSEGAQQTEVKSHAHTDDQTLCV